MNEKKISNLKKYIYSHRIKSWSWNSYIIYQGTQTQSSRQFLENTFASIKWKSCLKLITMQMIFLELVLQAGYSFACFNIIWQAVPFTSLLVHEIGSSAVCIALRQNKIISIAIAGRIIMKVRC